MSKDDKKTPKRKLRPDTAPVPTFFIKRLLVVQKFKVFG